jgi:hypothetical protein
MGLTESWFFDGIVFKIKEDLFEKLVKAPVSFYDNTPKNTIMQR